MGSEAQTKSFFVVFAPDKTDEGTLERRLAVRARHIADGAKSYESGFTRLAGAQLDENTPELEGGQKNMVGSVFICEAVSIEEVRDRFLNDVYYTSGVWDPEKLIIRPFIPARPF